MHSTDERRLRRFYRKHLAPAAAALRDRRVAFFALGPDDGSSCDSWYEGPPTGSNFVSLDVSGDPCYKAPMNRETSGYFVTCPKGLEDVVASELRSKLINAIGI